jgi:CRISPR-associated protein Csd1
MLLQALNEFYERATRDGLIKNPAFTEKYIRWIIPLDENGNLQGDGLMENPEPKKGGRVFSVPRTSRPKNAGDVAEFLWESMQTIFCLQNDPDAPRDQEKLERKHCDFWRQIEEAKDASPLIGALLQFRKKLSDSGQPSFLRWGRATDGEKETWLVKTSTGSEEKLKADSFTFQVEGKLLIEDAKLREFWLSSYDGEIKAKAGNARMGVCLVSGLENLPISDSHLPKISGVPAAASTGASLISFDKDTFCSYGIEKSYNSPVSFRAVEAYTNALNFLVASNKHCLKIADTALVFWAQRSDAVTDLFAELFEEPNEQTVRDFLIRPFGGNRNLNEFDEERFYSVTLGGNSGRVVVRNWMQTTVRKAVENFQKWFQDLEIVPYTPKDKTKDNHKYAPLAIYQLAASTVRDPKKELRAEVPTQLYRCALDGHAPSLSIAISLLNRIAVDLAKDGRSSLNRLSRFALLRLIVNRNKKEDEKMIEANLSDQIDDYAYNCGRLLAVFEDLQAAAHDYKLEGASVVERYYGTASSSPNSAFGILWRLHQHHLRKVARNNPGKAAALKQKIADISTHFRPAGEGKPPQFPRSFNLQEQGRFALGFYQQMAVDKEARAAYMRTKGSENEEEENR